MSATNLRILRLHAPLRYAPARAGGDGERPFPRRESPAEGDEEIALYEPDSLVRFDPGDGPRALPSLPRPAAGGSGPAGTGGPAHIVLAPEAYGFLQGRASTEAEWLSLVEGFARQAWWERVDCSGPFILRRVREDGAWAAQVWRRLGNDARSVPRV